MTEMENAVGTLTDQNDFDTKEESVVESLTCDAGDCEKNEFGRWR